MTTDVSESFARPLGLGDTSDQRPTERVVEKPVPANSAMTTTERTVYTDAYGQPATATTVYTTR